MKFKVFLAKVADLLDGEQRKRAQHEKCVAKALKKLRKKKHAIVEALRDETSGAKSKKLNRRLKIVNAQRRKAVKLLDRLRQN